jgi:hypothetical protein
VHRYYRYGPRIEVISATYGVFTPDFINVAEQMMPTEKPITGPVLESA